jgi:hypothetical protein
VTATYDEDLYVGLAKEEPPTSSIEHFDPKPTDEEAAAAIAA